MALRIVYPSACHCVRRRPCWSSDDEIASFAFAPRFIRRRENPLNELERFLAREFAGLQKVQKAKSEEQGTSKNEESNFTYNFDLKGFEPGDVKVKTVGKKVVVEAENEKKSDEDGYQSYSRKQYHQSVVLPDNVNPDDVISTLSDKGILRISAPTLSLPAPEVQEKEVEVQKEETLQDEAVEATSQEEIINSEEDVKDSTGKD